MNATVLVPWPTNVDHAPPQLPVALYDGTGDVPPLDDVEFYVAPYGHREALQLMSRMPRLAAVQVLTAGYDAVLDVLRPGVALHNGTGLHDASTAEHALALMLAAQRDLPRWALDQHEGRWAPEYTRSLADCHVLIVGYGHIGRAIEARLLPFETTVTRMAGRARPGEQVRGVADLHEVLPAADVVVLVLPDNPGTRGLIGGPELAAMRDDALLVNVGRGTAVDTAALLAEKGRVRACLDVMDPEPIPPGHPLWSAPGVLVTPHVAGGSATVTPRARRFVDEQVARWARGEPLLNRVQLP